jgi:hypothetical protein
MLVAAALHACRAHLGALVRLHHGERRARRKRRVHNTPEGHLFTMRHAAPPHVLDRRKGVPQPQRARQPLHL